MPPNQPGHVAEAIAADVAREQVVVAERDVDAHQIALDLVLDVGLADEVVAAGRVRRRQQRDDAARPPDRCGRAGIVLFGERLPGQRIADRRW